MRPHTPRQGPVILRQVAYATVMASAIMAGSAALAQTTANTPKSTLLSKEIVAELHSKDWHGRAKAFYTIVDPLSGGGTLYDYFNDGKPVDKAIRLALIDLLAGEVARRDPAEGESEEGEDYCGNFTVAAGALHDPSALNVLLNPVVISEGQMMITSISDYGEPIVPRPLSIYRANNDLMLRFIVAASFVQMLSAQGIDRPENARAVRSILWHDSFDRNPAVRSNAIKGLSFYDDPAARQRAEDVARSDPAYFRRPAGHPTYWLRDEAKKLLEPAPTPLPVDPIEGGYPCRPVVAVGSVSQACEDSGSVTPGWRPTATPP